MFMLRFMWDFLASYMVNNKIALTRAALEKMSKDDLISLFIENKDKPNDSKQYKY